MAVLPSSQKFTKYCAKCFTITTWRAGEDHHLESWGTTRPMSPWGEADAGPGPEWNDSGPSRCPTCYRRSGPFGFVGEDRFHFKPLWSCWVKMFSEDTQAHSRQEKSHGHLRQTFPRQRDRHKTPKANHPENEVQHSVKKNHWYYWIWRSDTFEMKHFTNSAEIRNTPIFFKDHELFTLKRTRWSWGDRVKEIWLV